MRYPITVEYVESGGGAQVDLVWKGDLQPREIVPASQLYPATPPVWTQTPTATPTPTRTATGTPTAGQAITYHARISDPGVDDTFTAQWTWGMAPPRWARSSAMRKAG